jgi:hypothetical protein
VLDLILPALGGLFATVALIVRYYDRRAKERAILAAVTDKQREDISSIPPLSLVFVLTLGTGLMCFAAFVGHQIRALRQELICAKDCASDSDCRPPSVCRRGSCVNTAAEARPEIAMYLPNRNLTTAWSPINGR